VELYIRLQFLNHLGNGLENQRLWGLSTPLGSRDQPTVQVFFQLKGDRTHTLTP
jgi:hypothetical protein